MLKSPNNSLVLKAVIYAAICVALSLAWFVLMFWFDGKKGGYTAALMVLGAGAAYGAVVTIIGADFKRALAYAFVSLPIIVATGAVYWILAHQL